MNWENKEIISLTSIILVFILLMFSLFKGCDTHNQYYKNIHKQEMKRIQLDYNLNEGNK